MRREAVMDPTGMYRYSLVREWAPLIVERLLFVMLNPSTADATQDDPTIRRCIDFARQWNYGSLEVVNLFAFRATDADELVKAWDPIGPQNNEHIDLAVRRASTIVAAWGTRKIAKIRGQEVAAIVKYTGHGMNCLGTNEHGSPWHPLFRPRETKLKPYNLKLK